MQIPGFSTGAFAHRLIIRQGGSDHAPAPRRSAAPDAPEPPAARSRPAPAGPDRATISSAARRRLAADGPAADNGTTQVDQPAPAESEGLNYRTALQRLVAAVEGGNFNAFEAGLGDPDSPLRQLLDFVYGGGLSQSAPAGEESPAAVEEDPADEVPQPDAPVTPTVAPASQAQPTAVIAEPSAPQADSVSEPETRPEAPAGPKNPRVAAYRLSMQEGGAARR